MIFPVSDRQFNNNVFILFDFVHQKQFHFQSDFNFGPIIDGRPFLASYGMHEFYF